MTTKAAIYVDAAAFIVGILGYLLPLPHPCGTLMVVLSGGVIVVSIGFGFKALFIRYPAYSFGIVGVLVGIIVCIAGFQDGNLMRKLSIHGRTAPGTVRGGHVTTTKDRHGNVQNTYYLDVSYKPIDGGEVTNSFSVTEAFGRKHVQFHNADSLDAKMRAANATDPMERVSAMREEFSKRPEAGDAFRGNAKPYVSDPAVEVRYVEGEPASAIIVGGEPPRSYAGMLPGAALILAGAGAVVFGIKSRPRRLVLPAPKAVAVAPRTPVVIPRNSSKPAHLAVASAPMVFISREGQQMGPFPKSRLAALLQNGFLLPADLAWHDGMAEWETLGTMLGNATE